MPLCEPIWVRLGRGALSRVACWRLGLCLVAFGACGGEEPAAPCPPAPEPQPGLPFIDATSALGVDTTHHLETDFCELPDSGAGPGVCLFDADGDGDLEIYLVDRAGHDNRLYQNDGGRFTDVTTMSGVALTAAQSMGCLAFDYDLDGDTDLYVTNLGPDVLLENQGGVFVDVTAAVGIDADGFSVTATAGDIDGDGDLDLFVGRLVDYDTCPDGCENSPAACEPVANLLFENRGGTFVEVAAERGIDDVAPTLAPLLFDFDDDGDLDLYVGNDIGLGWPDRLYINDGTGHFTDRAEDEGVHGPGTDTMGIDVGDYNGDGMLDMVVSDFELRPIRLFRCFDRDIPCSNDVVPEGLDYVKWSVGFEDFDNDADLDLFVTTGNVVPSTGDPSYLYFGDGRGGFDRHVPPDDTGVGRAQVSRGAAFGDLDNDGDVDIVIANAGDAPQILLNESAAGHWLKVALEDLHAGAMVTVTTDGGALTEQRMIGSGFAGSNDPRIHFGLGASCRAEVSVRYLDGTVMQKLATAGELVRF